MATLTSFKLHAGNSARPIRRATVYLLSIFIFSPPAWSAGGDDPLYQKGLAARAAWEQWFSSLQGDFKTGAFYWAGQRSLAHPGSCRQMDDDFFNGCTAAKERLAVSDAMRQTEPQYKLGWNAWTPTAATAQAPVSATEAPVAATNPMPPPMPDAPAPRVSVAPAVAMAPPTTDNSEEQFIAQITKAAAAYDSAPNQMAQGAVRAFRARALCASFPDGEVRDWTGTVEKLSSTNDGKGVLSIRISPHVTLSTTNNTLSESLAAQKTLIQVGSPLWSAVVQLAEGQRVEFSGRFSSGADCFEETSLTVGGGMADPDFIMRFFSVAPKVQ